MDKDRSRGIKHIKDKQKYKKNSTKNPKYTVPKNKPLHLASNWDRYETEAIDENDLTSGTNFELLSNAPISAGSFYKSKTNQVIEEEIEKQKSSGNKLFYLDLDMLQRSVAAVPFYQQIGISKDYFTEKEISEFDKEAAESLKFLDKVLKSVETVKPNPQCKIQQILIANETNNSSTEKNDEIEDLISNLEIEDNQVKENKKVGTKNDGEDLEKWLDDLLDD